jgi:hypothetical protein
VDVVAMQEVRASQGWSQLRDLQDLLPEVDHFTRRSHPVQVGVLCS